MGLLNGGGATILNSIFIPLYLNGTIYARESVYGVGGDLTIVETEYDAKVQVDDMTEAMRAEQGAADSDRRIIIPTRSTNAPVNTDVEIRVLEGAYAGERFQVASVGSDALFSHWLVRGRRSGVQA